MSRYRHAHAFGVAAGCVTSAQLVDPCAERHGSAGSVVIETLILTTKTIIFVGSLYQTLYRTDR